MTTLADSSVTKSASIRAPESAGRAWGIARASFMSRIVSPVLICGIEHVPGFSACSRHASGQRTQPTPRARI
jgi:hypothetical protein